MILNIKHLMGDLGLTQNDIANIIGEYQSVVSLFVQGKRYPMDRHIEALEKAYGKDVVAKYFVEEADIDFNIGRTERVELKRLMGDFDLSQRQMAEIIGTTQSEVSQLSNGNRKFMKKHTDALVAHFGQEVIDKYTLPADAYEPKSREATVTIINPEIIEEAKEMGRQEVRATLTDALTIGCSRKPTSDQCPAILPFVGKDIAASPDYDIRKLVEEKSALLGVFSIMELIKDVKYVQLVITMAMAPRYMPGDFLFVGFTKGKIISGQLYLVDTQLYGTMLRHVYIEENGYRLKARNSEFKDVFLKFEDVYSIMKVLVHVNTNTSLTSDINLAELVKTRDEEVLSLVATQKELIESQNQVLKNQAELIAEIREQSKRMERIQQRQDALVDKIINKE